MGWLQDGIALGNKWSDDAALKARQDKADARQATEDAWTTEERGRTREKNVREDGARKVVQDQAGVMITDAEKTPDWRKAFGLPDIASPMLSVGGIKDYRERGPKADAPQPDAPAQATDAAPVSYAEPGDVKPAIPVATAPAAPNPFAQQRAAAISLMKIGQANGDYKMIQEGQAAVQKVNANEGSTGIINWAATASDAEVAQAMKDITLDKRNKYEAVFDPKTGFTNIKSGDAEAAFTRPQLGMYLAAKHRLNSGDPTAYADMKAISAELTAKDAEARKSLMEISAANNLTNYHSRSADNKDELAQARLAALSASTARAGAGGRQGQPGATEVLHAGTPFNFTKEYENNLTHFRRIASGDGAMMGDPMTEKQIANKAMLQTQASKGEWDRVQTIETKSAMLVESVRGAKTPAQLSSIVGQAQSRGYNPEEIRRAIAQYSSLVK